MESVVKAVGPIVAMSSEDGHDKDGIKSEVDLQSLPTQSGRKRRHSSGHETSFGRVNYHIGSRYWGDDTKYEHKNQTRSKVRDETSRYREREKKKTEENEVIVESTESKVNNICISAKEKDPILMKTGGAYIPPARLRLMQAQITDKSSVAYQRLSWEALKKSIHGLINKVNVSNIPLITRSLM